MMPTLRRISQAIITRFILLWFLIAFASTAIAQKSNINFKRITINDGLSLSSVYCIYEDKMGFLWFGTEDGLNKYDGNGFTIYRSQAGNENSISYKWTEIIFEDSRGQLWFGSKGGLTTFNPKKEIFGQYRWQKNNEASLSNDTITAINEDNNGNLWIGTMKGLNRINLKTGKIERISFIGKNRTYASSRIFEIVCEQNGDVWIGSEHGLFFASEKNPVFKLIKSISGNLYGNVYTLLSEPEIIWAGTNEGLIKYEKKMGQETLFGFNGYDKNTSISNKIEKLVSDQTGKIWAGTPEGLFLFNRETGRFRCIAESFDATQSLSVNTSKPICVDSYQNLWYGTFGSGLYKINTESLEVENFMHNTADPNSISENSINCIYEDRADVIWIGTFGAGISVFDKQANKFKLIKHDPLDENSLSSNFIWSILEAIDGSIWIGTNTFGLNRYSPETGKFTKFTHNVDNPTSLSASSVRKVYQDSKGIIWVGTDGGGLNCFNAETEEFTNYMSDPDNPQTLTGNSIRVIFEDRAGNFWVGTRNGLNLLDRETGICKRFIHNPENPESISHNFIYSAIHDDKHGNLWIGTYGGGLNKMNIKNETFKSYTVNPNDPASISNNIVFSICEIDDGIMWVGTNDGLNRFDIKNERFIRFGVEQGLPNEVIYGVLPDNNNNLWLSTNLGISKFNLNNHSVENFDVSDGLQSNEFNGGAFYKGVSGKLYFGGVYGLNVINPDLLTDNKNNSNVVLTGIDVLGKEVLIGNTKEPNLNSPEITKHNEQFYMQNAIPYANKIVIDYKHNFLGFEFATLNIPPSEKVTYSYKMQNMDDDWTFAGSRNFVTYANMAPGSYTFMVIARNAAGKITPNPANLKIIINSPFWKTWWFYFLEIIAAFLLAALIWVYLLKVRTNKLLVMRNKQIQEANRQLTESEKKLKELNTTKDKFFSIIAHDLKNPFTSLLSISELLSKNYESLDEEDKKEGIDGFYNSARRIYSLLENLLVWSRSQTGRVKFNPIEFDIAQLAKESYNLLALNAEKKGIILEVSVNEKQIVFADPEMINTVLRNFLHNAIKYTHPGGKVRLIISEKEQGLIKIAVIDQGVGIDENRLVKLFNLASKANSNGTAGEKGTGLGLIVCKEFIERNSSKLIVKSKVNKGSEFSFFLQNVK